MAAWRDMIAGNGNRSEIPSPNLPALSYDQWLFHGLPVESKFLAPKIASVEPCLQNLKRG
jgi:hypothetical protein